MNFCFDRVFESGTVIPNLARVSADITEEQFTIIRASLSNQYPFCDYPRLLDYAKDEQVDFTVSDIEHAPAGSFYFININFFDESIDYFALLSPKVLKLVKQKHIQLLFFYCEADLPDRLDTRLKHLCVQHSVDPEQVHFISHNTRAQDLDRWYYFNDDELLYNRTCNTFIKDQIVAWHNLPRNHKTTCLIRTHKNWRAVFAAQLYKLSWPDHSYLSYCGVDNNDLQDLIESPFKTELNRLSRAMCVDPDNRWLEDTVEFLSRTPIEIDSLDNDARNLYRTFVPEYFKDAYWNIVVETHIDVENVPGVFITEKTWKPIAHAQPFVIMGTPYSLQHLRDLGYQTFGSYIDESYDTITDHVKRTYAVLDVCRYLSSRTDTQLQDINNGLENCIKHNQQLLLSSKKQRIEQLFQLLDNS